MILRRARRHAAIDLGSRQIKALVVEQDRGRPRIETVVREGLAPGAVVAGEILDYHTVFEAVCALKERLGGGVRRTHIAVAGRDVIVKRIRMDRMREAEARQVIRWEAEQHVPFDMDSVRLDFEILDPDAEDRQMEVLVVAAKRDLVDTRVRLLEACGLEPTVVDVDAFAVQNAWEANYEGAGYGTACIVNVGYEVTNLSLVDGGRPILTRDLAVGERRFAEALVAADGISFEEALSALEDDDPSSERRTALAEPTEQIVAPIERAQGFLATSEGQPIAFDEIVVSGGGCGIFGLKEALSQRLDAPVTVLDPFRSIEVGPGARAVAASALDRASLAVAVGLGLRNDGRRAR